MKNIDINLFYIKQAQLIDPDNTYNLVELTKMIINNPFNLFLIQVCSSNIEQNIKNRIYKETNKNKHYICKLAMSLKNKDNIKKFKEVTKDEEIEDIIGICSETYTDDFGKSIRKNLK